MSALISSLSSLKSEEYTSLFEEDEPKPAEIVPSDKIGKFSIVQVPKEEWPSYSIIAGNWEKTAALKQREVGRYHPLFSTYSDSIDLCAGIKEELLEPSSDEFDTVIVCKDSDEKIQAIALHKSESNSLNVIVTNPSNLKPPSSATSSRLCREVGAGSAIMLHLVKKTLSSDFSNLTLYALERAVPFYQRLSFSRISGESDPYMELTKSKIETLVASKISPFHLIS